MRRYPDLQDSTMQRLRSHKRDREPDLLDRAKASAQELRERDATWLTAIPKMQRAANLIEELLAELEKKPPEGG